MFTLPAEKKAKKLQCFWGSVQRLRQDSGFMLALSNHLVPLIKPQLWYSFTMRLSHLVDFCGQTGRIQGPKWLKGHFEGDLLILKHHDREGDLRLGRFY